MAKELNLVHLYPDEMNIYGDTGNVLVIKKRAEWRGIKVNLHRVGIGDNLPEDSDIIISGGGQDQGQVRVCQDLQEKAQQLHKFCDEGVVCLVVCGTYQLFGDYFKPYEGEKLNGIEIFDAYTEAKSERLIGNIVCDSEWGELVGYENHSGNTYLRNGQTAFATVLSGEGNNDQDTNEGCRKNNFFGTYMHGPLLPKNPRFADELINLALKNKYSDFKLKDLNDTIEYEAKTNAIKRPR